MLSRLRAAAAAAMASFVVLAELVEVHAGHREAVSQIKQAL